MAAGRAEVLSMSSLRTGICAYSPLKIKTDFCIEDQASTSREYAGKIARGGVGKEQRNAF